MDTIMITAPSSGTGKTLISLGIIRALKNKGIDVSAFKTGGDFLDTMYLSYAAGKRAGNLDIHLYGTEGIKNSLSINRGDLAIIEGAMGYFDGIANGYENSSYDISRLLGINAIMVYHPKGEMFSAIPKIKGMVDFSKGRIKALILNRVNEKMYLSLKDKVEEYIGIKVLGYIESDKDREIESQALGLAIDTNRNKLASIIEKIAIDIEKTIDINEILKLCCKVQLSEFIYPERKDIKVAIAYDEAFSFYYSENIKLFENVCKVEYFSPLRDYKVPDCDFLYMSGGNTYDYREELSNNLSMKKSIKEMADNNGFIYAESGGLMYLAEWIDHWPMCGILRGKSIMGNKLDRFGYIDIQLKDDCVLARKGEMIKAHEFHKSISYIASNEMFSIKKTNGDRTWECGYKYKNVLAVYPHLVFLGNMKSFFALLEGIERSIKEDKSVY